MTVGALLELSKPLWPRRMKRGVIVRLKHGACGPHFRLSVSVSSHLGMEHVPQAQHCPEDAGPWAPQSSHGEGPGPHFNGLHLAMILQRRLGRKGELWVSAAAKQLRRGFSNVIHSHLECSAQEAPGSLWETGFFWTERLLESELFICPSAGPSAISLLHPPPYLFTHHPCGGTHRVHTWTSQSRPPGSQAGKGSYHNRHHYVTRIPGAMPSAPSFQQFSSRGIWQHLETFLVVTAGGYYWLVVGRSQESCHTSRSVPPLPRRCSLVSTVARRRNPDLHLSSRAHRPHGVGAVSLSSLDAAVHAKPGFREVKSLAQNHAAGRWPRRDRPSLKLMLSVVWPELP